MVSARLWLSPLLCFLNAAANPHLAFASDQQASLVEQFETGIPFSFLYDGKPSKDFLSTWRRSETNLPLSGGRRLHTIIYRDPATHLEVRREITIFPGGKGIDWLLRLRNGGTKDSPALEKILTLNFKLSVAHDAAATFHHVYGSTSSVALDYVPVDTDLNKESASEITHYVLENDVHKASYLPFFNVQWPDGGLVGAVGWTGQWMVRAERSTNGVLLKSGQEVTHIKLHAGESIRTPRILLVPWSGTDRMAGQNALRRLLLSYYAARVNGRLAMPPVAHTGAYALIFDGIAQKTGQNPLEILPTVTDRDLGGQGGRGFPSPGDALNFVTEKNQLEVIHHLPPIGIEAYWLDAGWMEGLWPGGRGSWVTNKTFPDGLAPLSDAAHKKGLKFLLWFEPEGVSPGTLIAKEHPEWVLHRPNEGSLGGIFRFGKPAAQKWITDLMAKRILDWHVDIFRMDHNTNPILYWRNADTEDRQGITEIRQIEGLYAMWDGLLRRFPGLIIDNANWRETGPDLEAMHRTLGSLTRSEVTNGGVPFPAVDQAHTAELSMWVPFSANILNGADPYNFRSTATTGVAIGLDLQSPYVPAGELRKAITELKMLRPYWLGDYYPLTPINSNPDTWCGWQFHRQDLNAGFAMFFRRPKSEEASYQATLEDIDLKATYQVSFAHTYDVESSRTMTGSELAHLQVAIEQAPGSLLVRYREVVN
jgi:alpha-galactosidase